MLVIVLISTFTLDMDWEWDPKNQVFQFVPLSKTFSVRKGPSFSFGTNVPCIYIFLHNKKMSVLDMSAISFCKTEPCLHAQQILK